MANATLYHFSATLNRSLGTANRVELATTFRGTMLVNDGTRDSEIYAEVMDFAKSAFADEVSSIPDSMLEVDYFPCNADKL